MDGQDLQDGILELMRLADKVVGARHASPLRRFGRAVKWGVSVSYTLPLTPVRFDDFPHMAGQFLRLESVGRPRWDNLC